MGIFDGVLIASDLDGTLLGADHALSDISRSALELFMREGGKFAIATGRSRAGANWLKPWEFSNAPAVLSNGGLIYDYSTGTALFMDILNPATITAATDILKRFPRAGVEVHCPDGKYIINPNPAIDAHMRYVRCEGAIVPSLESVKDDWLKVLFVDAPELVAEICRWTRERFAGSINAVFSNVHMFEIQNTGTDKGSGVKKLAELLAIEKKHVYTAGDAENDLEMLLAFESFAPENAEADIKASARHLLPSCDDHAIASMINILWKRYAGSEK